MPISAALALSLCILFCAITDKSWRKTKVFDLITHEAPAARRLLGTKLVKMKNFVCQTALQYFHFWLFRLPIVWNPLTYRKRLQSKKFHLVIVDWCIIQRKAKCSNYFKTLVKNLTHKSCIVRVIRCCKVQKKIKTPNSFDYQWLRWHSFRG